MKGGGGVMCEGREREVLWLLSGCQWCTKQLL